MRVPHVPLVRKPTPLHRLDRLSEFLGLDLWIKRDDLTGFALGGNKGRKLEYLMADAVERRAEVVVTCGAAQSNFVRQLGAACAVLGMRCVAAVMDLPYEPEYGKPQGIGLTGSGANLMLDSLFGVEVRRFADDSWDTLFAHAEAIARDLEAQGTRVHRIPIGGSSVLGAYGFVQAAGEIMRESRPFDYVVSASSSGSTQAGLAYGFHQSTTKVVGISCDPEPDLIATVARLCGELDELIGAAAAIQPAELDVRFGYVGPGYGVPSEASLDAIRLMAKTEGIALDPIYSGKAFAGLLDMARSGVLRGRVLFWHTGGVPTLFATPQLSEASPS